ncbi:MAG TPA: nuclear transport factor 2 family protein [Holophagaceae bacterium]|nr:nuclear transport factor 2 family protein [Holophagaceae bacterium]
MILLPPALITPAPAPADDAAALVDLARRHTEAQRVHDPATLTRTTAEAFVEVSPVGDVDSREKMLGFYGPGTAGPTPEIALEEPVVRVFGDTGLVIARMAVTLKTPEGGSVARALRVTFVARRLEGTWKLVSTQYTGIRPAGPKAN